MGHFPYLIMAIDQRQIRTLLDFERYRLDYLVKHNTRFDERSVDVIHLAMAALLSCHGIFYIFGRCHKGRDHSDRFSGWAALRPVC